MNPRLARLAIFLMMLVVPALAGSGPAHAQMYKWTDERGVVNYSNEPPKTGNAAGKAAGKALRVAPVPDRISTYSNSAPIRSPSPAPSASAGASGPDPMRERVEALERELEQERRQRGSALEDADERRRRAYEECLRGRGVDCDQLRGELPAGFGPAVVIVPARPARMVRPLPLQARDMRPQPMRPASKRLEPLPAGTPGAPSR